MSLAFNRLIGDNKIKQLSIYLSTICLQMKSSIFINKSFTTELSLELVQLFTKTRQVFSPNIF